MTDDHGERRQRIIKIRRRTYSYLFLGTVLAILAISKGCEYLPESTFTLANESRLPKWLTLPPGLPRTDVSVTMSYITKPWGSSAQFIVQDAKHTIMKVDGKLKCNSFQ